MDCFLPLFANLFPLLEKDSKVTPLIVAQQMIYWTDANNLLKQDKESAVVQTLHPKLAMDFCFAMLSENNPDFIKFLANIIVKLNLDKSWDAVTVKKLVFLCGHLLKIVTDKTANNSLKKFTASLMEIVDSDDPLSPQELLELKEKVKEAIFRNSH